MAYRFARARSLCVVTVTAALANPTWVQVHVDLHYQRTGTITSAAEGSFTYKLDASLDQVMERLAPEGGSKLATYVANEDDISAKLSGTSSLKADVTQRDGDRTFTASADLTAALSNPEEFHLKEVGPGAPLGEGYMAELNVSLPLKGSVKSTYPRMPGVDEKDSILLWPTPAKNDAEKGLLVEGEVVVRPVMGPRPKGELEEMMYDMTASAEELPGLGALRMPSLGAVTTGTGEAWVVTMKKSKTFSTMINGGTYTDTVSVEIKLVPLKLPPPKVE